MKLCAIYNVWDDWDLLYHSTRSISDLVDGVIIVYSDTSNFGEMASTQKKWVMFDALEYNLEPDLSKSPAENERAKRNYGLDKARELGYTHFLMMDADEFYEPEPFLKEKQRFIDNPDLAGLVCGLKCYFKLPTLSVEDKTLVPFIHKITPNLKFEWNTKYPFAFEGAKREIRIDPTRQMNITEGVEWSEIIMHHMSWIRSDVKKKIRNSTARQNIEKSTILTDYCHAKEGYYCEFYGKTLVACENLFNINDIIDHEVG
tara:strand:- start:1419 stop:2195 length:777 start_codon:yes stop_codon:yes gene_type:complete